MYLISQNSPWYFLEIKEDGEKNLFPVEILLFPFWMIFFLSKSEDKYGLSILINLLPEWSAKFRRQPATEFWLCPQDSKILLALIKLLQNRRKSWRMENLFTLTALLNIVIFSLPSSYLRKQSLQNIDWVFQSAQVLSKGSLNNLRTNQETTTSAPVRLLSIYFIETECGLEAKNIH